MTVRVGTLRAASDLILLLDVASECSVSVILGTQYAASLHPYIPTYQHANMPTYQYTHLPTYLS